MGQLRGWKERKLFVCAFIILCLTYAVSGIPLVRHQSLSPSLPSTVSKRAVSSAKLVDLGRACPFIITAQSAISTVVYSNITGDIGLYPVTYSSATGFSLSASDEGSYYTSGQINGRLYAANNAGPLTLGATSDGNTAYTAAAGQGPPSYTGPGVEDIAGRYLWPGIYRWPSDLHISSNLVLNGNCGDVYVFQISGVLTTGDYSRIQLVGGISAATIFWQIAGGMTTGSYSDFSGVVLSATTGILGTKATFTGMIYAQTAITSNMAIWNRPVACINLATAVCHTLACASDCNAYNLAVGNQDNVITSSITVSTTATITTTQSASTSIVTTTQSASTSTTSITDTTTLTTTATQSASTSTTTASATSTTTATQLASTLTTTFSSTATTTQSASTSTTTTTPSASTSTTTATSTASLTRTSTTTTTQSASTSTTTTSATSTTTTTQSASTSTTTTTRSASTSTTTTTQSASTSTTITTQSASTSTTTATSTESRTRTSTTTATQSASTSTTTATTTATTTQSASTSTTTTTATSTDSRTSTIITTQSASTSTTTATSTDSETISTTTTATSTESQTSTMTTTKPASTSTTTKSSTTTATKTSTTTATDYATKSFTGTTTATLTSTTHSTITHISILRVTFPSPKPSTVTRTVTKSGNAPINAIILPTNIKLALIESSINLTKTQSPVQSIKVLFLQPSPTTAPISTATHPRLLTPPTSITYYAPGHLYARTDSTSPTFYDEPLPKDRLGNNQCPPPPVCQCPN